MTRKAGNAFYEAVRWRAKRLHQYTRVRYLSLRCPEVEISGIRIPLGKHISDNVREAMFGGGYEAAELRTIGAHLDENDRVMELGTGIGLISAFCAKAVGSDRVFTYEANPDLEMHIKEVFRVNGVSPRLEMCMLGRGSGTVNFFKHKDFWSSSKLDRSNDSKIVTVPQRDLNEEIRLVDPSFLIVDIEGGETDLFDFIDLHKVMKISVELHTHIVGKPAVEKIKNRLFEEGFKLDQEYSTIIENFKEELFLDRISHV